MFADLQARPDCAQIDAAFGFPVPELFARLLQHIYDKTGKLDDGHESYFEQLLSMYMTDAGFVYDCCTPPELFAFGHPGVDGVHFGFIIHDEKLGPDWPIGHLCPMDSNGVTCVGVDPAEGLANLFAATLRRNQPSQYTTQTQCDARRTIVLEAAAALGLTVDDSQPSSLDFGFGREPGSASGLRRPIPRLPSGWRLLPTLDGLGVAAPVEHIHPDDRALECSELETEPRDIDDYDASASAQRIPELFEANFPASALLRLRDLRIAGEGSGEMQAQFVQAYEMLDRPLLVRRAKCLEF